MRQVLIATMLIAASSSSVAAEPRPIAREDVPAALAPAAAMGDAAIDAFRDRMLARLNELIVQGGPVLAIQVCRTEAPDIAKQVAEQHRLRLGRAALRLRNPGNAPPPWARGYVEATSGRKAGDVKPVVIDLGDRIGLLRPIAVMPMCTRCHGAVEGIDPEVRAELARHYPADRATGFAPGDLRGFFWVEAMKH